MASIDVPVALLGYGTVGSAVNRLLTESAEDIERARTCDCSGQCIAQQPSFAGLVSQAARLNRVQIKICDPIRLKCGSNISVRTESQDAGPCASNQNVDV